MKKISLFMMLALGALVQVATAQQQPDPQKPTETLWINQEKHDFGKIRQGVPVFTEFELKSVGDSLRLEMVQAGCGCTTPEFKAGTYAPNEIVKIKVGFNALTEGPFNKPVYINYNNGQQKVIYITGEVEKAPAGPAPTNGAISKIKM